MNSPSLSGYKMVQALPSAQRTGSTNGDVFYSYLTRNEPIDGCYTGWMRRASIYANQSAGSGNDANNYLAVTIEGRHEDTDPWTTLPQTQNIRLTNNGVAGYYAACVGPLMPELRIVVTEVGTADATFQVHVLLED